MARFSGRLKWLVVAPVLLLGFLSFEVYRAFYPGEAFYRGEFERVAKASFPTSGRLIFSTATYPDIHGDYRSCGVFRFDADDFTRLMAHIGIRPHQVSAIRWSSECRDYVTETLGQHQPFREWSEGASVGERWSWGLLDDGKTVLFEYASW